MTEVVDKQHLSYAHRFKQIYSAYQQSHDLISVGAYTPGSDPKIDEAIAMYPHLTRFLQQGIDEPVNFQTSVEEFCGLMQVGNPKANMRNNANPGMNR